MKVLIPAAGEGTRFRPLSKAVPKELLPVGGKPVIQLALEEAAAAGITEAVVVISPGKESIRSYLTPGQPPLDDQLEELLERVSVTIIVQDEPKGLGHAILTGAAVLGEEPFGLILPDNLVLSHEPPMQTLLRAFKEPGDKKSIVGLHRITPDDAHYANLGAVEVTWLDESRARIQRVWDKGSGWTPGLDLRGGTGRAIFTTVFIQTLAENSSLEGDAHEITALNALIASEGLEGIVLEGAAVDVGTWDQYVRAIAITEGWPILEDRNVHQS
jgi:UTP--glucose-1-phosphate uridylyltransferase